MSPPATPSGKLPDTAFVAPAGEALGGFLSFSDGLEECAGPKASPNNKPADPVGDVEKPVDEGDVRWFFKKNRRVKLALFKHFPLSNTQTRRVEVVPSILTESLTPVANVRTGNNAFRFQKVSPRNIFQQPTVRERSVNVPALSAPVPTPANDNDEWPVEEAA